MKDVTQAIKDCSGNRGDWTASLIGNSGGDVNVMEELKDKVLTYVSCWDNTLYGKVDSDTEYSHHDIETAREAKHALVKLPNPCDRDSITSYNDDSDFFKESFVILNQALGSYKTLLQ